MASKMFRKNPRIRIQPKLYRYLPNQSADQNYGSPDSENIFPNPEHYSTCATMQKNLGQFLQAAPGILPNDVLKNITAF